VKISVINAFTGGRFKGNPAGVFLSEVPVSEPDMQSAARQMGLSETAFLVPSEEGYQLRWFTPEAEVKLCGHATLASAFYLWDSGRDTRDLLSFQTLSGRLTARRIQNKIELDFPAKPAGELDLTGEMNTLFGIRPVWTGKSEFDLLAVFEHADQVRSLQPDFEAISRFPARGIIVTAPSDQPEFDFVSRFFAPAVGVNEDPVTGSAHCVLAPFWAKRTGKLRLTGYQASERGGVVEVELKNGRVLLRGIAEGDRMCEVFPVPYT